MVAAMTRRTITLTLTEAQFGALASAVALADCDWDAMSGDDPQYSRDLATLDRAWIALNTAWHAKARRRAA
jgi:hypothetical protein